MRKRDRHNHPYRQGSSDREEFKDELHRQRQEFSDMIHSGRADPDPIDRKMEQIDCLGNRLDTSRR